MTRRPRDPLAADPELAAYLAVRWVLLGRPASSLTALATISQEYFGVPDDRLSDAQIEALLNAQTALEQHTLLPPTDPRLRPAARVNHSVMFRRNESAEEQWAAIDSILADGLWPQPETVGKYSENPHAVFFVADAPPGSGERRYSEYASWITADLPFKVYDRSRRGDLVEYRGKILLDMLRNVAELRPGSVGAVTGIPPEFIVGINGCPVALFDAAISRWGRW